MARGGFHDQIGGGFHRYSVDEAWIVPHFEKMADDNAWLLRNYIDAYAVFGDERFKDVARGIIAITRDVLSDPGGGFHASQDADVVPEDECGYLHGQMTISRKFLLTKSTQCSLSTSFTTAVICIMIPRRRSLPLPWFLRRSQQS
jgi:uncharacterized protein YyaL (SSP411 family)